MSIHELKLPQTLFNLPYAIVCSITTHILWKDVTFCRIMLSRIHILHFGIDCDEKTEVVEQASMRDVHRACLNNINNLDDSSAWGP